MKHFRLIKKRPSILKLTKDLDIDTVRSYIKQPVMLKRLTYPKRRVNKKPKY